MKKDRLRGTTVHLGEDDVGPVRLSPFSRAKAVLEGLKFQHPEISSVEPLLKPFAKDKNGFYFLPSFEVVFEKDERSYSLYICLFSISKYRDLSETKSLTIVFPIGTIDSDAAEAKTVLTDYWKRKVPHSLFAVTYYQKTGMFFLLWHKPGTEYKTDIPLVFSELLDQGPGLIEMFTMLYPNKSDLRTNSLNA